MCQSSLPDSVILCLMILNLSQWSMFCLDATMSGIKKSEARLHTFPNDAWNERERQRQRQSYMWPMAGAATSRATLQQKLTRGSTEQLLFIFLPKTSIDSLGYYIVHDSKILTMTGQETVIHMHHIHSCNTVSIRQTHEPPKKIIM